MPVLHVDGDLDCDFAVIGGGLTGLFAALELSAAGKVVVLEAATLGQKASGRNNGQVIPHHSKSSPSEIVALLGKMRGDRYNALVANAPLNIFDLVSRYGIACDAVSRGWIQAAHSDNALARARVFFEEWRALGCNVEWLDAATIRDRVGGGDFCGGWKAGNAGYLNPFALVQGLARAAVTEGVDIRQNATVKALVSEGARWRITTSGGNILARRVLVATNATTDPFWPGITQAAIPIWVYQIATKPLPDTLRARILKGGEGVSDTSRDIRAFRYDAHGGLAMVGTHTNWMGAESRGKRKVIERLRRLFPDFPSAPAEAYWEGVIGLVPDRMPRLMQLAPGLLFAGIYSGRGIAMSSVWGRAAARFLAELDGEAEMPVPVTGLRRVPMHRAATVVANLIHPIHRMQDKLDMRKKRALH